MKSSMCYRETNLILYCTLVKTATLVSWGWGVLNTGPMSVTGKSKNNLHNHFVRAVSSQRKASKQAAIQGTEPAVACRPLLMSLSNPSISSLQLDCMSQRPQWDKRVICLCVIEKQSHDFGSCFCFCRWRCGAKRVFPLWITGSGGINSRR